MMDKALRSPKSLSKQASFAISASFRGIFAGQRPLEGLRLRDLHAEQRFGGGDCRST